MFETFFSAHGVRHGVPFMGDNYIDVTFQVPQTILLLFYKLIGQLVIFNDIYCFAH